MMLKLTDRQSARWTVIASYHFDQERLHRETGNTTKADFHKDSYNFLKHIEAEALKATPKNGVVCPICDGHGCVDERFL